MSITLKQLAQLIIVFVNKTFVPALQSQRQQHQKCLQYWRQVSDLISDVEKLDYFKLDNCIKKIHKGLPESKSNEEFKNKQRKNSVPYKPYETGFDYKNNSRVSNFSIDEPFSIPSAIKSPIKSCEQSAKTKIFKYTSGTFDNAVNKKKAIGIQTKNSYDNCSINNEFKSNGFEKSNADIEGYDKIINSFRKLCQNFESNQKKMLREDDIFKEKQNYKEQFTSY